MFICVLNDGETWTALDDCAILEVPDCPTNGDPYNDWENRVRQMIRSANKNGGAVARLIVIDGHPGFVLENQSE